MLFALGLCKEMLINEMHVQGTIARGQGGGYCDIHSLHQKLQPVQCSGDLHSHIRWKSYATSECINFWCSVPGIRCDAQTSPCNIITVGKVCGLCAANGTQSVHWALIMTKDGNHSILCITGKIWVQIFAGSRSFLAIAYRCSWVIWGPSSHVTYFLPQKPERKHLHLYCKAAAGFGFPTWAISAKQSLKSQLYHKRLHTEDWVMQACHCINREMTDRNDLKRHFWPLMNKVYSFTV